MYQKLDNIAQLENLRSRFEIKARLLSALRDFFSSDGFLEVSTPVRIDAPAPEEYIEAVTSGSSFLRTSPELEMKRLLAAGYEKIYQIGPCFRAEEYGRMHRPEFLMLEWYQAGADYNALLEFTRKMLTFAALKLSGEPKCRFKNQIIDFSGEWKIFTVNEAFCHFAGVSVFDALNNGQFEELLVEKVEPSLPRDIPVVLKDYPAEQASLARLKNGDSTVAERWELYLGGVEIANAFSELVDPAEQKTRFKESSEFRRKHGMADYPEPVKFIEALDYGMPESSGCALGIDRLAMIMADGKCLADVVFPK